MYPVIDLLPDQRRIADKAAPCASGSTRAAWSKERQAERAYGDGLVFDGTATATRSPATASGAGWRMPGWSSPGPRPTAAWSR